VLNPLSLAGTAELLSEHARERRTSSLPCPRTIVCIILVRLAQFRSAWIGAPRLGPNEPRRPYAKLSAEQFREAVDHVDRQIEQGILKPESPEFHAQKQGAHSREVDPTASETDRGSHRLRILNEVTRWQWITVAVIAFLFGVFVWPTPFEYHPSNETFGAVLRISRFSGRVDYMTPSGWVPIRRKQ
jgi:hypothetical protein